MLEKEPPVCVRMLVELYQSVCGRTMLRTCAIRVIIHRTHHTLRPIFNLLSCIPALQAASVVQLINARQSDWIARSTPPSSSQSRSPVRR